MTTNFTDIRRDLTPFADLGTDSPHCSTDGTRVMLRMIRGGETIEIELQKGKGKLIERSIESRQTRTHASLRALLASERFADLRLWANNQKQSQRILHDAYERRIQLAGEITGSDGVQRFDVEKFDDFLVSKHHSNGSSVRLTVIDGPAGIGKTRFIEFLAWLRATRFYSDRRPLVLHVQSRGRVLTYLQDLIAFNLQRMRLNVTFDQVPVLVRHGLVTLAIDGFDELADPNGYELAWGQLSELIDDVRGNATLILAGRDTFIDEHRIRRSIQALRQRDDVQTLALQPPLPQTAKDWLRMQHSQEPQFADELLGAGSIALRPFFLVQIAELLKETEFGSPQPGVLLSSLIDTMIEREAGKFGDPVEHVMTEANRRDYVRRFLREVARFMADDQTDAIDELSLTWMAEVAAPPELPDEVLGLLRHRAAVITFLEKDDTPGYRRFSHSTLFNFFLGDDALDALPKGDLPKYLRRSILGSDFLATFSDLVVHLSILGSARIKRFFESALETSQTYPWDDRGAPNLGALLIATLPAMGDGDAVILRNIQADEALLRGTIPPATMQGVTIRQLDIQNANVESLEFFDSYIGTLTVDEATVVSPSIPRPVQIQYNRSHSHRTKVISEYQDVESWLAAHGKGGPIGQHDSDGAGLIPIKMRDNPMVKVLGQACRSRSFWIPEESTNFFEEFTREESWPLILDMLKAHDLVRVSEIPASGPNSIFYHIKQQVRILTEDGHDENVKAFYETLVNTIAKETQDLPS